ncbi:MAG: peptidoglycan DD-metalloendopeptidase family protein [Candidatus Wallbacteria bacterium]
MSFLYSLFIDSGNKKIDKNNRTVRNYKLAVIFAALNFVFLPVCVLGAAAFCFSGAMRAGNEYVFVNCAAAQERAGTAEGNSASEGGAGVSGPNLLEMKRKTVREIEEKIIATEAEIKKTQQDAENAKTEYFKKQEEYKNTREELSSSQQKSVELYETRMRLAKELKLSTDNFLRKKFLLKSRIRAMYKNSFKKRAEFLVNSGNIVDFYMNLFYLARIIKSDTEFIAEISKKVVQIKAQREELNKKLKELELLNENNKNYEKSLKLATLQINDGISKYAQKEQLLRTQLTSLSSEKVRLEKDISEMQQTAAKIMKIEPALKVNDKNNGTAATAEVKTESREQMSAVKISEIAFTWPLKKSKNVISFYGVQKEPKYNVSYFNSGIDISGENNEEVVAAAAGVVKYKGEMKSVGKILMIDHGGNITTLYSHLKSIEVGMGQKVNSGEILGSIANEQAAAAGDDRNGEAAKPCFLHFELRIEGTAKDPMDYF